MKKNLKEYLEKYGHIPNDFFERFTYLLEILKPNMKDIEKVKKGLKRIDRAKWVDLNFVFYFIPQATPRPRYSGRTKVFFVRHAGDNSDIFRQFVEECEDLYHLITTPCKFHCEIFIPTPSQMSKAEKLLAELKRIVAVSKPDWDNAGKTYSDMVQKHLILDDCLIVDGGVKKFYSFKPRIEIHIEYMENYDCKFNKKKIESWKSYNESIDKIEERESLI